MQRRILLADSDPANCRQLQELLAADPDILVDSMQDGKAALQTLGQDNYSIFVD